MELKDELESVRAPISMARSMPGFSDKPDTRLLTDLAAYVEAATIKPIVDKVYPLSSIADAHRAMEAGGRRGKQIISLS